MVFVHDPNLNNLDKRKAFGIFAPIERQRTTNSSTPWITILALEKFCGGGHIERSNYRVGKQAKPTPKRDDALKKVTQKYFKLKEEEFEKYEEEVKARLRKKEELRLKRERELDEEERRRKEALQEEVAKMEAVKKIKFDDGSCFIRDFFMRRLGDKDSRTKRRCGNAEPP